MSHIARKQTKIKVQLTDAKLNNKNAQCSVVFFSQDYTEDYIQTGPDQLYALSTRMFSIDKESVPYTWNHTVSYDPSKGKMPYLVETLRAAAISAHYHPLEEVLEYSIQASISKGERERCFNFYCLILCCTFTKHKRNLKFVNVTPGDRSNQCPRGFTLVAAGPYCAGNANHNTRILTPKPRKTAPKNDVFMDS